MVGKVVRVGLGKKCTSVQLASHSVTIGIAASKTCNDERRTCRSV